MTDTCKIFDSVKNHLMCLGNNLAKNRFYRKGGYLLDVYLTGLPLEKVPFGRGCHVDSLTVHCLRKNVSKKFVEFIDGISSKQKKYTRLLIIL